MSTAFHTHFALSQHVWLNAAAQAPMPLVAAQAAHEAVQWKLNPANASENAQVAVPFALKRALAALLGGKAEDFGLGTSATYGLDLLARSMPLRKGDEILLFNGEFPTTVLPWLPLRTQGVSIRFAGNGNTAPHGAELEQFASSATKVVCLSHVNSFHGGIADLPSLAKACASRGIWLVVNASQSLGILDVDVLSTGAHAVVSCSEKWLCGPHGAGIIWVHPVLRAKLALEQVHYAKAMAANEAKSLFDYRTSGITEEDGLDLSGYGHFIVHHAMAASIRLLTTIGTPAIFSAAMRIAALIRDGLERRGLPDTSLGGTPIVRFSMGSDAENASAVQKLRQRDVHVSLRAGQVRVSPHFYSTEGDAARFFQALDAP